MGLTFTCVDCGAVVDDTGESWLLLDSLVACSKVCGERWALHNAAEGYGPGQPHFSLVRFVDGREAPEPTPDQGA